jgi:magnesium transporter
MTTGYVALPPETKLWQAVEEVRKLSRDGVAETIDPIYVVAYEKLIGVVSLRDLILGDPGQSLADVMSEHVVRVLPTADQEEVANTIAKYDFKAIPVCDDQGRMLGVVTIDDVVDVVIEEATEDAQRMGAVEPMEAGYFETGYAMFFRKRVIWLVVLFLGELLTANVIHGYEGEMQNALALVIFIPLIISSGGNAGSQSSSLIIRALAVGEMIPRDWAKVFVRELAIGLALGIAVGLVGFARAYLLGSTRWDLGMAMSVGLSVVAVVTLGATVGSLLPLLMKRLGLDPAVSSTPFIASLVDVLGLLVYFTIAKSILGLSS